MHAAPIGVFDSGIGGLSVLRALRDACPDESLLYLGDTARLPYGSKSAETVVRYAEQAARVLVERGVKMLVVACNTASAVALDHLRAAFAPLPVIGVVEPGAEAAARASRTGEILVLATEGTVRGGAYVRAIHARRPTARVVQVACPLFVALAEEGWVSGPIAEAIAQRYLGPALLEHPDADCAVLGCTHFPALRAAISAVLGPRLTIVDSAATTAAHVAQALAARGLAHPLAHPGAVDRAAAVAVTAVETAAGMASCRFLATDAPDRFARVAPVFIGGAWGVGFSAQGVELIDL